MPNFDPTTAAQNWVTGMGQAGTKVTQGVNRVQTSPGQLAAQQANKYLQRVQERVGVWQRRVAAVPLEQWRSAMINKGIPRMAQGAQQGEQKYQAAAVPLFQYMQSVWNEVNSMDSSTPAARDARMLAWSQRMRQYTGA